MLKHEKPRNGPKQTKTTRNEPKPPTFITKSSEITHYFLKLCRKKQKNIPKNITSPVPPVVSSLVSKFKIASISMKTAIMDNWRVTLIPMLPLEWPILDSKIKCTSILKKIGKKNN